MMTYSALRLLNLVTRCAGGALFVLACVPIPGLHPWIPLFFSLFLLGVSARLDYRYWRCPHCHRHLGKRMFPFPSTCPHCQFRLGKTDKVPNKKAFYAYQEVQKSANFPENEEKKDNIFNE
ncbi:hypothetical protein [Murdochiella massiliensis]|uniref:hypothetical protein n=1 Tax=Murdochiella massiliensis TaxID=1673723 RepID=UPI0011DC760D|nr:hypothetical protein [Murdochiella massiliensis]